MAALVTRSLWTCALRQYALRQFVSAAVDEHGFSAVDAPTANALSAVDAPSATALSAVSTPKATSPRP